AQSIVRSQPRQVLALGREARDDVIDVATTVALIVARAPKLAAVARIARFDALRTGRLDLGNFGGTRRTHDQHGTRREPHDAFGDRAEQDAFQTTTSVRADDD